MANLFHINIASPGRVLYDGMASSVIAPGKLGYFGILAHHAPFVSTLGPGKLTLRDDRDRTTVIKSGSTGFLEVSKDNVLVILDSAETQA